MAVVKINSCLARNVRQPVYGITLERSRMDVMEAYDVFHLKK